VRAFRLQLIKDQAATDPLDALNHTEDAAVQVAHRPSQAEQLSALRSPSVSATTQRAYSRSVWRCSQECPGFFHGQRLYLLAGCPKRPDKAGDVALHKSFTYCLG
jgi:hypothetical protein